MAELACAALQAGGPDSEVSEGRAASQLVSAEFRRAAASRSAGGWTAQECHDLRPWTVGSSWASMPASPPQAILPRSGVCPGRAARHGPGSCPPPLWRARPARRPASRPPSPHAPPGRAGPARSPACGRGAVGSAGGPAGSPARSRRHRRTRARDHEPDAVIGTPDDIGHWVGTRKSI